MRHIFVLPLAVLVLFAAPATAQHRVLVKFHASPTVKRAVESYTPLAVGSLATRKSESPHTGLPAVDRVLQAHAATTRNALIPRHAQGRLRARFPATKSAQLDGLFTLTEFQFPESASLDLILHSLNALPQVAYAESRPVYHATPAPPPVHRAGSPERASARQHPGRADRVGAVLTPNDPRFPNQYAIHNTGQTGGIPDADTDAPEAWNIQTGSRDVLVAVLDSGIDYTHPDIAPNIWTNPGEIPGNGLDDDQNGYVDDVHGYDFFHGDADPMDDNVHGTHVAGTIGAAGNNGIGVTGMAWDVQLIAVKFLGPSGSGSESFEAVTYALVTGAPISNNSWGGGGQSEAFQELMELVESSGHLFLAAAGNDSVEDLHYPGAYPQAMAIASTDHNDLISGFSNFGNWVELSAPGTAILSTLPADAYGHLSGTSMAAPQVAGVAALLKSEHPDWTADQIRSRLKDTADPIDHLNPGFEGKLGSGRLNAHAALLPAAPRIEVAGVRIDDDQFGQSAGNLDGAPGPGETLEVWLDLSNVGAIAAEGVTVTLTSGEALVQAGTATYGTLPFLSTGSSSQEPFRVHIPAATSSGTTVTLAATATDTNGGRWPLAVTLDVAEPASITGTVSEIGTGAPIQNAQVNFSGSRSDFVLSEADGTFAIREILSGETVLSASAAGYSTSDPQLVTATSGTTVDIALGAPALSLADPQPVTLDWGATAAVPLQIANVGTDSLIADVVELPTGTLIPPRVGVVRSTSVRAGARTWAAISSGFGPVAIDVDMTSLASAPVTAARIEAAGINVLYIGPPTVGSPLSSAEIAVVREFVEAGGGLVVAGALDTDRSAGQTEGLADLLGLESAFEYASEASPSRFLVGPGSGIGARLVYPYASAAQTRSIPAAGDWTGALVSAQARLLSDDGLGVVTTRGRRVFLGHPAEGSTLASDRRLVYNALLHAAFDQTWLELGQGAVDLAPGEQVDLGLAVDAGLLDPGGSADAAVLVTSDGLPDRLVPISLTAGSAARLIATVEGEPRAGAQSDITITVTNMGTEASPAATMTLSTTSEFLTLGPPMAVSELAPGASVAVQTTSQADADTPHGTPALLNVEISAPGGQVWSAPGRLTITRLSLMTGTVVSAGGPVVDEPVTWTGPLGATQSLDGIARTGSDGAFTAELADGSYLVRAGGDRYAQTGGRIITVPPDTTGLLFTVTRPGIALSATEIETTVVPGEAGEGATTVQSTGDVPVNFHADWLPVGLSSRLDELLADPPPADPPIDGPATDWTWGRLLILQDEDPLGSGITEPLLQAHGVPYDIFPTALMGSVDLSPYTKVLVPSNQGATLADGLTTHRDRYEAWVQAGGVLQLHLAFNNQFEEMVGGLKRTQTFSLSPPVILDYSHPMFREPAILDIAELAPLALFADGYFTQLPASADTLLLGDEGRPVAVELPLGGGAIIATNQLVEDSRPFHENMLLYRLRHPAWAAMDGTVSGRLDAGASSTVVLNLGGAAPDTRSEARLRIRTTDATAKEVIVPVVLNASSAPLLVVAAVAVDDDDGVLDAGEEADLVLTIQNGGSADATGVVMSVTSSDLTVLTPSVTVGTVPAGGSSEAVVRVSVDAGAADGTNASLVLDAAGDNVQNWTIQTSVVIRADPTPPAATTDLRLVRAYRSGAVVEFTEPGDDGQIGTVDRILFAWSDAPITDFDAATTFFETGAEGPGAVRVLDVSGLPGDQVVHLAIRAIDDAGNTSDVSNSLELTTAPAIDVNITAVYSGIDGVVGAGDQLFLDLSLTSVGAQTWPGVSVQFGGPGADWLHMDGRLYRNWPSLVGAVGPGTSTTTLQGAIASSAPVGAEVALPIVVLGEDGLPLDRVRHVLTIEAEDTEPPRVGDNRLLAGIYDIGDEIGFSGNVYEPGPVDLVQAVVSTAEVGAANTPVEVARVPLVEGEDGRWSGAWTADQAGEFTVAYEATDAAGNTGTSEGGAYQGFSTREFESDARNLLVVDAVGASADADGLRVADAMAESAVSSDTWRTMLHGRDVPAEVMSAYDGSLVYVAPQGSFSTLGNFGTEDVRQRLGEHMATGGSVLLATEGLYDVLPASWLLEWFGVESSGAASGTATGVIRDVVGEDLSFPAGATFSVQGASPVFVFGDEKVAGARYDGGRHRSVVVGARLSGLDSDVAGEIVRRAVTWMSGDPSDTVPPAGVESLKAQVEDDQVVLTWYATGDDGRSGRAMAYSLRYADTPPGADWGAWWEAATPAQVSRPAVAFTEERLEVSGLDVAGNWFFALRVEDDGRNLSPFSNLARVAPGHPTGAEYERELPTQMELFAPYPNPASVSTVLRYAVPEAARIRLELFDVLGRRVAILDDAVREPGYHQSRVVVAGLGSGVYWARLAHGSAAFVQKVVVVR